MHLSNLHKAYFMGSLPIASSEVGNRRSLMVKPVMVGSCILFLQVCLAEMMKWIDQGNLEVRCNVSPIPGIQRSSAGLNSGRSVRLSGTKLRISGSSGFVPRD